jgi:hypothetical protein
MEKKEHSREIIKRKMATAVSSSIRLLCESFITFKVVSTTKQKPRRLEDAFKM